MRSQFHYRNNMVRARGFTLIELLIVIALLVVLLTVGVPGMTAIITKTRLKNASFDVYSSILSARNDAVSRNKTVTITPSGGNWSSGWTVTDSDGNTLKTQVALRGIAISGPASLVYNSTGHLPPSTALGDRRLSVSATDAADGDKRCITIDLSGRPVVTPGVCS